MSENKHDIQRSVLEAIRSNSIQMRPRWYFLALSMLLAATVLILVVALLYASSLTIFFMRESGVWYASAFGSRGWYEIARSIPLVLLLAIVVLVALLEMLVRKYALVYKRPLIVSLGALFVVVLVGAFALAQTSFHREPSVAAWHGALLKFYRPVDMYRGTVVESVAGASYGYIVYDEETGTSTVFITAETRLPYGNDFSAGDYVVVMGDSMGTGTIRAYGVRKIDR